MQIKDISSVMSFRNDNLIFIDCIHEDIKDDIGDRYEVFVLNKNNELIANFKSNKPISGDSLDENCNLFAIKVFATDEEDEINLYRVEEDNTYTFLNTYEDIEEGIEDGYFAVKKNGLWGFINAIGEEVITPQYNHYRSFYEGFATVRKNRKWGVIDKHNNVIIPFEYLQAEYFRGSYFILGNYDSCTEVFNTKGERVFEGEKRAKVFDCGNGTLLVKNKNTKEYEFVKLGE